MTRIPVRLCNEGLWAHKKVTLHAEEEDWHAKDAMRRCTVDSG
jgi:hypothetical protein